MKKLLALPIIVLLILSQSANADAASTEQFEITDLKLCRSTDENRRPINVTSEFPAGTHDIYAWFAWKNAEKNQQITAKWEYASEDIHILDTPVTLTRRSEQGVLSLRMPKEKSLPSGTYRLDIEASGKVLKSASFTVR